MSDSLDAELETARLAAAAASAVHLEALGSVGTSDASAKGRSDFVSEVDLAAQEAALDVIASRHPDHRVLAEEMTLGERTSAATEPGPLWIVDPLDGTTNFLHGHPYFCSSVGLVRDGRAVVGAVDAAVSNERWWAATGFGTWYQAGAGTPTRARVSRPKGLDRALIATGFPFKALHLMPEYTAQFGRVLSATSGVRRCGAAALDLCYVASGRVDGFWEAVLGVWDIAGGAVIAREAGAIVERIDGSDLTLESGSVLSAATEDLAVELRALLSPDG